MREGSSIKDSTSSWTVRTIKGAVIGAAFTLPGISAGAMAVAMGLYQYLIFFLADIRKNFWANILFFLPVGLGFFFGLFLFSLSLGIVFQYAEVQLMWLFIGCILGTLPDLWKQASREGRGIKDVVAFSLGALSIIALMGFVDVFDVAVELNLIGWLAVGSIIAFGVMVPGLSTATLLIVLGFYQGFTTAVTSLDLTALIPIGLAAVVTLLLFSRATAWLFNRAYSITFHIICGFVVSSAISIVPLDYDYASLGGLLAGGMFIVGCFFGRWISRIGS